MLVHQADNVWREVEPEPLPELPEFYITPKVTYLSRHAMCVECRKAIHEAPGETNHWYFEDNGPFCPNCALVIEMRTVRAEAKHECWRVEQGWTQPITIIDISPERSLAGMHATRPKRDKTILSPIEEGWRNLEIHYKKTPIKNVTEFKKPLKSLDGIERFIKRVQYIMELEDQQKRDAATNRVLIEQQLELPDTRDILHSNGLAGSSMSSSEDDDDSMWEVNNIEKRYHRVATEYNVRGHEEIVGPDGRPVIIETNRKVDIIEMAAIMRRIEWERFALACGPALRVGLVLNEDGTYGATPDENTKGVITVEEIKDLGQKIKAAVESLGHKEIMVNRANAYHFGYVGSILHGVRTGPQYEEQTMDALGAEDLMEPEGDGAPVELGIHTMGWIMETNVCDHINEGRIEKHYSNTFSKVVNPEPSEVKLWPEF